ncbi:SPOR domain-containing protein [Thioalkalivibrio sulfidiphilus]|uniref:SPOR domain-containing protein n=1 Tax=Thioalkalivibrio sulfidiphilus TaxID=1033854 RepID=UPI000361A8AB|nr:SPOR domain-containing protein [Thioalkalivibrio sulfidiphilus]
MSGKVSTLGLTLDPRLKQRLVGAAVLLALAVIFLPMLLDGTGHQAGLNLRDGIPPEPEFARPEAPAPLERQATPVPPQETRPAPRSEARAVPQAVPQVAPQPVPEPAAPAAEPAPQSRTPTAPAPATPPPAPTRAPAAASDPGPGGWAVQVGSFGERANAEAERDRLRRAGFQVLVEPARAGDRQIFRVKVGPVSTREEAERLRSRLGTEQSLQGIVVTHP